jgi:hypothetical protein
MEMRTHTTGKSCSGASRMQCLTYLRVGGMAGFFIVAGCTPTPTTRQPTVDKPEPKLQKPITTDSTTDRDVYATPYSPGRLQYDLQIFSVARVLAGDSTHRSDSTHVIGLITTTFAAGSRSNTAVARVESDSIAVIRGTGTSVPLQASESLGFAIDTQTGEVEPTNPVRLDDCSKDGFESSPIDGREVLPTIHALATLNTWTDTVSTFTCRGGALLRITRVASYARLQSPDSILHIARITQFQITGNGQQWNQKIEVSGDGTSTDTLRLGGFPLRLQVIAGSSQTRLVFKTELRLQEFIQTSRTRIVMRGR